MIGGGRITIGTYPPEMKAPRGIPTLPPEFWPGLPWEPPPGEPPP
jgi:hypothetical protein